MPESAPPGLQAGAGKGPEPASREAQAGARAGGREVKTSTD